MKNLDVSFRVGSDDHKIFANVINKGIDSRLEAFTKSEFKELNGRIYLSFNPSEFGLLLRRLCELEDSFSYSEDHEENWENVYLWINDIVYALYEIEII